VVRIAVHSLVAWISIPRDCWADFMKVAEESARSLSVSVWERSLVAVHCRAVWVVRTSGWERALDVVHCLRAWVSTPIDSCADLMNVADD
jgi:hypothetical protein